ncbi:hypothetical protein Naga_100059g32 [Nannochloropsis gaditana]|uniref:Uncharacterized protein n=1 Tax=Nannochloropsis gaditana TaxID=72520 RepID=W7TNM9_9STRA|nr:hypothetical protein Naga_100059g32 [Nannochloropsis gaditana]
MTVQRPLRVAACGGGWITLLATAASMAHPAIAFLHGPRAPSSSWTVTQNHAVRDFLRIREDNGSESHGLDSTI